ncbi:MAG TPA: ornithine cyclodeaminase family protein [Acidobacteriaceae bacterium]|jgi:thiomorpholine-carboxylate dehydrogenase|nr:ornithine cyclodeaminase family protein [Acidobacteriaceae bacterium]
MSDSNPMLPVRLFHEDEIRDILHYEALIPAMEHALIDFSSGAVQQPARTILRQERNDGWFACMPAIYKDVMGAKLVTFFPGNIRHALPTHMATIQIFNPETGQPLAILDGRLITEMRTAAVSAVAVRLLAAQEANVLAILGSGVQARAHLEALSLVRPFTEVRIAGRTPEHAQALVREIAEKKDNRMHAHSTSAEDAVRGADVVVTVTSSPQPVLQGAWLKEDALVVAVGAVAHDRRELDDDAMQGTVIVESREAALRESGDIMLSGAQIYAELGELLSGQKALIASGRTIFKSLGVAAADLAAARLVYQAAKPKG